MIIFCGDSWVEDVQKDEQWSKLLTKKLYNTNNINEIYYNFAAGGTGVDHLCQEQLIHNVLPILAKSKIDYLIIGISYSARFALLNNIYYQPNNENDIDVFYSTLCGQLITYNEKILDKKIVEDYYNSLLFFNTFFYKEAFKRYMKTINSILRYIESTGTKIIAFHVDNQEDEYQLDERFYIKGKTLIEYYTKFTPENRWDYAEYSNHMAKEENISLSDNIFDEIKN